MQKNGRQTHARLVPELKVTDLDRSLAFYVGVLGFRVLYNRPESRYAFLDREGAQLMIEEPDADSSVLQIADPRARGIHLQIEVDDVVALYAAVHASGTPVETELHDRWYRAGDVLLGNRQFYVADPDGYLLRFFEDLGEKPAA